MTDTKEALYMKNLDELERHCTSTVCKDYLRAVKNWILFINMAYNRVQDAEWGNAFTYYTSSHSFQSEARAIFNTAITVNDKFEEILTPYYVSKDVFTPVHEQEKYVHGFHCLR